jgi:hypothetical protein
VIIYTIFENWGSECFGKEEQGDTPIERRGLRALRLKSILPIQLPEKNKKKILSELQTKRLGGLKRLGIVDIGLPEKRGFRLASPITLTQRVEIGMR